MNFNLNLLSKKVKLILTYDTNSVSNDQKNLHTKQIMPTKGIPMQNETVILFI